MNLIDDEGGIIEGMMYAIITIALVMVTIIAVGPVMYYVQNDMYGELDQEDTIFRDNDAGWNKYMNNMDVANNVWEMSFIFFIFIAIVYMFIRGIRKQTYTQRNLER